MFENINKQAKHSTTSSKRAIPYGLSALTAQKKNRKQRYYTLDYSVERIEEDRIFHHGGTEGTESENYSCRKNTISLLLCA